MDEKKRNRVRVGVRVGNGWRVGDGEGEGEGEGPSLTLLLYLHSHPHPHPLRAVHERLRGVVRRGRHLEHGHDAVFEPDDIGERAAGVDRDD
jgi:hypothetical protein